VDDGAASLASGPGGAAAAVAVAAAAADGARPPARLRHNLLANMVGSGWTALAYVVCVPLYIKLMGIESYGLVGFFVTLVAVSSLLELGLGATLNRELARRSVDPDAAGDSRDLVRTLELIYWGLAATMGALTVVLAPTIAHHWLRSSTLSAATVQSAIILMGLVLTFQWPLSLYSGGLRGLERQVALNSILVVMMTIRTGGAVLVLWLVTPTIHAFFVWQLLAAAAHTGVAGIVLWRILPAGRRARFRRDLLRGIWRFAAGLSATSVLILVLTQSDKVILSSILSLRFFAYYSLAALAAGSLAYVFLPAFQAAFPRFSALVAAGDEAGLIRTYHRMAQVVAVLILPSAILVAAFSRRIVEIWTGSADTASHTHTLLTLLILGTALNGLMTLPYALSLAYGWTRWPFFLNLAAVVIFLPALVVLALTYGGDGAAAAWLTLNAGYVLVGMHTLHRRLLPREKLRWYLQDVAAPTLAAAAVVAAARALIPAGLGTPPTLALLAATLVLAVLAAAASVLGIPRPSELAAQAVRLARSRPNAS
jgi:O-antigen/teichoic acid export membrane protein